MPKGNLVRARGGGFAVECDLERMETQGEPVAMVMTPDNSLQCRDGNPGVYVGTVCATPSPGRSPGRGRRSTRAASVTYPRLSPDEKSVALDIGGRISTLAMGSPAREPRSSQVNDGHRTARCVEPDAESWHSAGGFGCRNCSAGREGSGVPSGLEYRSRKCPVLPLTAVFDLDDSTDGILTNGVSVTASHVIPLLKRRREGSTECPPAAVDGVQLRRVGAVEV